MKNRTWTARRHRWPRGWLAVVGILGTLAPTLSASPAAATYEGNNGRIAFGGIDANDR